MGWIYEGIDQQGLNRDYSDWYLLKKIMSGLKPFKLAFTALVLGVLGETITNLIAPLIFTKAIDIFKANGPIRLVYLTSLYFLGSYIVLFIFYFIQNIALAKFIPDFMVNLRTDVFNSIQKQDLKFFDKQRSGKLTSRVGPDAADSANIIMLMGTFSGNILLIIFSFVILFSVSPQLAVYVMIIVPFIIAFTWFFRRIARRLSKTNRKTIASVNASISESVEGISVAKSFGMERETLNSFKSVNRENVRAGFRLNVAMEFIFPTLDIFLVFGFFMVTQIGGNWAITNQFGLDATSLYLFILYINRFFFPLMNLSTFYSQMQAGFASYERIAEVLDAVPEVDENLEGVIIPDFKGDIQFKDVNFGYTNEEQVLEKFNLHIKPGEKLAIVGHTGAGKTTIANIVARFYEFQGGDVLIDNHDIRCLNLKEYRKNLGIVQQGPFLFSGTVKENILYGKRNATDEEIDRAIKAVHADEFIQYMPDGLLTEVGERGSRLSTGQRQLVCFARAILPDPKIIILDEATSAVDAYTEAVIQEALDTLFYDRTSIVIAHRLSTVLSADRIIVLDHGKIIEEGSHEYLMQTGGKYQELYETYFKHQSLVSAEVQSD